MTNGSKIRVEQRARVFRILKAAVAAQVLGGGALFLFGDRIPVPGELFGLSVMEFVGFLLVVLGIPDYLVVEWISRRPPPPR